LPTISDQCCSTQASVRRGISKLVVSPDESEPPTRRALSGFTEESMSFIRAQIESRCLPRSLAVVETDVCMGLSQHRQTGANVVSLVG
jgi:hypothetical protein